MAKKKRRVVKRRVGKKWFTIVAPKEFNNNVVGETMAIDKENLLGRVISAHLSDVSGDVTKRHIKLRLKISSVDGEKAKTKIVGYEVSKPFLQRMIRRRSTRVDNHIDAVLKDGTPVRIKGIASTVFKTNVSQRSALVHALKEQMEDKLTNFDLPGLIMALSTTKPQKEISKAMKKVYPTKFVDVRKIEILSGKKKDGAKEAKNKSAETPAQKSAEEDGMEMVEKAVEEMAENEPTSNEDKKSEEETDEAEESTEETEDSKEKTEDDSEETTDSESKKE